jgi:hypothetical protein
MCIRSGERARDRIVAIIIIIYYTPETSPTYVDNKYYLYPHLANLLPLTTGWFPFQGSLSQSSAVGEV